jgi:membrane-associated phospholipid phosphatase
VKGLVAGLLALALPLTMLAGDPNAQTPAARMLFTNFLHDQKVIWTQPRHLARRQAPRVVLFAVITAALIATDRKTSNALPNTVDQIGDSAAISRIGAAYTNIGLAGGLFALGRLTRNDHLEETGFLGLETLADTLAFSGVVKLVTQRERPTQDRGRGHFFAGGMSFPSGHSIMSWGLAEVIADEYHDRPLVRVGAYSLATLVSLSRVSARQHFLSDVFAGGAAGVLIGSFVYHARHDPARRWSLMPLASVNPGTHTYAAGLRFTRQ